MDPKAEKSELRSIYTSESAAQFNNAIFLKCIHLCVFTI
jgi:hypothetical protein